MTKEHGARHTEFEGIKIPMVPLIDFTQGTRTYSGEYLDEEVVLPSELKPIRDQTIQEIISLGSRVTNAEALALDEFAEEPNIINFRYRPLRYFTYVGTNLSLDKKLFSGKTLRETYGDLGSMLTPEGYLASRYSKFVGTSTVIVTSDNKTILQRRSSKTAVVTGLMHVGLAEGMHRNDKNEQEEIDPVNTVLRGFWQELSDPGKRLPSLDINPSHIKTLALGISQQYLQADFAMLAQIPYEAADILERAKYARGKWERSNVFVADFKRANITRLLKQYQWSPHGPFALAMAFKEKENRQING